MIKLILTVITVLLAIFGLTELLHSLWLLLIAPKRSRKTVSVVWLEQNHAEQQLYFAAAQGGWLGRNYADHIVAVDSFVDSNRRKQCESIAQRHQIILCPKETLTQVLQDLAGENRALPEGGYAGSGGL